VWKRQFAADDVLRRADAAIPDWKSRLPADKTLFERLVKLTRLHREQKPACPPRINAASSLPFHPESKQRIFNRWMTNA
jgi:hypothetical protein